MQKCRKNILVFVVLCSIGIVAYSYYNKLLEPRPIVHPGQYHIWKIEFYNKASKEVLQIEEYDELTILKILEGAYEQWTPLNYCGFKGYEFEKVSLCITLYHGSEGVKCVYLGDKNGYSIETLHNDTFRIIEPSVLLEKLLSTINLKEAN